MPPEKAKLVPLSPAPAEPQGEREWRIEKHDNEIPTRTMIEGPLVEEDTLVVPKSSLAAALEHLTATKRAWETDRALHWTTDGADELVARAEAAESRSSALEARIAGLTSIVASVAGVPLGHMAALEEIQRRARVILPGAPSAVRGTETEVET